MQIYEIIVQNRAVRGNSSDMTLVRTSIGIDAVHVLFDDPEWLGFPVTMTFAQGDTIITQSLVLSAMGGSDWAAEASCIIPHEVVNMVGPIRVTLQGTDSNGRHIITAKGSPLSVEESGDVVTGEAPSDAPTIDQWQQAYAQAMEAANAAQSVVDNLQSRIDEIVANAQASMQAASYGPATRSGIGLVQIGNGLAITPEGLLSAVQYSALTSEQEAALINLSSLAYYCFDTEFDENGRLKDNVQIKHDKMPRATIDGLGAVMPDGTSITIDEDGVIHATSGTLSHSWNGTVLTVSSMSGSSSADLHGARIAEVTASVVDGDGEPSVSVVTGGTEVDRTYHFEFSGLKGERGEQGPSGYVLSDDDLELISQQVYETYLLGDTTRY